MHIITTNRLSEKHIKKFAGRRRGFVLFGEGENADKFAKNLKSYGFEQIDLREIVIKYRSDLRQAVIEFSGALNCNVPHYNWWAVGISRRVAMYPFSNSLAKIFLIRKILDYRRWDSLVIYDESVLPWAYLIDGKHEVDADVHLEYPFMAAWNGRVKSLLPFRTVLWFLWKIKIKTKLGWSSTEVKKDSIESPVALFTLIDKNSFPAGSFRDVYLGDLSNYIKKEGRGVSILGLLHDNLSKDLLKAIKLHGSPHNPPLFLLDYFWSLKNLIYVTGRALRDFFRPPPKWAPSRFMGFDVRRLLTKYLRSDLQDAYAESLLNYQSARKYFQQIKPDLFIYPYENKCIERMLLKAIEEICPDTKKIGYQHAVLTPKHIHMYLAPGESKALPLPDKIVTNGRYTARILQDQGNYPGGMVVAGTALRITAIKDGGNVRRKPPERIKNILMTLAEGREEYDKAFNFLRNIQMSSTTERFDFRVRLHPGIPYDPFKSAANGVRCIKDTTQSLVESLGLADLILYASTSVAVQAMACGIPVIWMDLLDFWGTDPIDSDNLLRWKLNSPEDWDRVLYKVEHLSRDEFNQRLEKSIKFASDYFFHEAVDIKKWLRAYA